MEKGFLKIVEIWIYCIRSIQRMALRVFWFCKSGTNSFIDYL